MQAATMAWASSGCWSNAAASPPRGQKPWQPIGAKRPDGDRCAAASHSSIRRPVASVSASPVQRPAAIRAWQGRALS
jgi:hypothetical protein